jgi:DNA-binding response OmpR family regulator
LEDKIFWKIITIECDSQTAPPLLQQERHMSGESVLIVDDSAEITLFLRQYILEPAGYKVLSARDGEEGLEVAVRDRPDLIILDMSMPRMTGLQMLSALRKTTCDSPVIFMTLHGSERIAVEVFRLGVKDYLCKPFTVEEVREAVDRALKEKRLLREKEELSLRLAATEAIQRTMITLSHHINNSLVVVLGGLRLTLDLLKKGEIDPAFMQEVLSDCLASSQKIQAVIRTLGKLSENQGTTYYGDTKMIDLDSALQEELPSNP